MIEADYIDVTYLGFVLRVFRTNVVVHTADGMLLANLKSVPTARAFCREQRRIDKAFSNNFAALDEPDTPLSGSSSAAVQPQPDPCEPVSRRSTTGLRHSSNGGPSVTAALLPLTRKDSA